jgi:hypothetical protein
MDGKAGMDLKRIMIWGEKAGKDLRRIMSGMERQVRI